MRSITKIISGLALTGVLALSAAAQTPAPAPTKTTDAASKQMKPAKTAPAPKSDAEIQSAIQQRLAAAPKLKSENISVTVLNGVATFTGTVHNSGSKGGVSSLAKAAGAKSVVNNITIDKPAKTPAPAKTTAPTTKP